MKRRTPEQLRTKADRLETQAADLMAEWERHRGDIAYLTQPAPPNSPFAKRRDRASKRHRQGLDLIHQAKRLRERADRIEQHGIPTKGDAERGRQARREQLDTVITVGSRVFSPIYRHATVQKVNRKTYTVQFPNGSTMRLDKTLFRPAEEVMA